MKARISERKDYRASASPFVAPLHRDTPASGSGGTFGRGAQIPDACGYPGIGRLGTAGNDDAQASGAVAVQEKGGAARATAAAAAATVAAGAAIAAAWGGRGIGKRKSFIEAWLELIERGRNGGGVRIVVVEGGRDGGVLSRGGRKPCGTADLCLFCVFRCLVLFAVLFVLGRDASFFRFPSFSWFRQFNGAIFISPQRRSEAGIPDTGRDAGVT